ncbi:competence type IV pilus minor pilin ComGD [Sediminibacillus halophilus]|uniref:Competence protein ComGD n=1 Tax=Sediminibacillus halophilus TaxID=482461 RepID=A0A1G9YEW0_9BACI|nr:competence type IV pilus minor pilin ComGD [Sediminibacillus halophilus]SDN07577.1 competence protein ComGD [Sediminibacillus halophilus]
MKAGGFTFIEVMIVLGCLVTLTAVGITLPLHLLEKQETKDFFQLFDSDLIYLQQSAMLSSERNALYLDPKGHKYTIRTGGTAKVILERKIPKSWKIELRTLKIPLSFNSKGTIKQPGTMIIYTDRKRYKVVFPLGKGRHYYEEL